ncbi:hypothetical protein GJ654_02290 [Rhodoblastus acidophilus]|uniref:Uncharacterized protein n=1 Tax=Rhodoblastus acidophilus TaxID=1074 RepID=A0A6N8DHG4_RHOAC|nr:hypothetical protein [Rhodoblastus acidophilus]MCW2272913.1 putative membrane protein [Rhodoblastus acidophilus]MTV29820.1 hypothetical protein [Rhodoblastus acidophilus]
MLAIEHWIGGVGFVTRVVLPLASSRSPVEARKRFEWVERRFAAQIRLSIPLAGAAGLWMTCHADLWERFIDPHFWWMAARAALWAVFMTMVFGLESLGRRKFEAFAWKDSAGALRRVARPHGVLLALAAITVLGEIAWLFFPARQAGAEEA